MADIDVSKLKVAELKSALQGRGLPVSGLKAQLATRLQEAIDAEAATRAADAPPAVEDPVQEKPADTQEISGDIQDATEAPGPTELLEGPDESTATKDPLPPASPAEVVQSHIEPPTEGGLTFSSSKPDGEEGAAQQVKRKRSPSPSRPVDEGNAVEPPAVQEEHGMVPNDEVPPPPAEVAARMEEDDYPERKKAKLDELATTTVPSASEPTPTSTAVAPERPASISIKGAARQATQSPELDRRASTSNSASAPSPSFFISNLTRPCPDAELQELLREQGGPIQQFYINKIKTHAIVTLDSEKAASAAISALQGTTWPTETGRPLHFQSLPSAEKALELVKFDQNAGGRNRFALHTDPFTGNVTLRTAGMSSAPPSGPRGLASASIAAAGVPMNTIKPPPPLPAMSRMEEPLRNPIAYTLHKPEPSGGPGQHFKLTEAKPPLYYREALR